MNKDKDFIICGKRVMATERQREQLCGVSTGDKLSFRFYDVLLYGMPVLMLEARSGEMPSPKVCAAASARLQDALNLPVVFSMGDCPAYIRQRMVDKDLWFVAGDQYAFLPMLVATARARAGKIAKTMTPVAQYILLYQLEVESLEGLSAREVEQKVPYSYESVALGLTCLSDLGLLEKHPDGPKRKIIHWVAEGRALWEKAEPMMLNPVQKRYYADGLKDLEVYYRSGINALATISHLLPTDEQCVAVNSSQMRAIIEKNEADNLNELDGSVVIEVWRYPVVCSIMSGPYQMDTLSLILSLRDDEDPRVEKEIDEILKTLWTD